MNTVPNHGTVFCFASCTWSTDVKNNGESKVSSRCCSASCAVNYLRKFFVRATGISGRLLNRSTFTAAPIRLPLSAMCISIALERRSTGRGRSSHVVVSTQASSECLVRSFFARINARPPSSTYFSQEIILDQLGCLCRNDCQEWIAFSRHSEHIRESRKKAGALPAENTAKRRRYP